ELRRENASSDQSGGPFARAHGYDARSERQHRCIGEMEQGHTTRKDHERAMAQQATKCRRRIAWMRRSLSAMGSLGIDLACADEPTRPERWNTATGGYDKNRLVGN